jgi:hypothetical protein
MLCTAVLVKPRLAITITCMCTSNTNRTTSRSSHPSTSPRTLSTLTMTIPLQMRLHLLPPQRPNRRFPPNRLLTRTQPNIPRQLLPQHINNRRNNRQNRKQRRETYQRHQQDINPILQPNARKINANQAPHRPPHQAVDQVDGEDVREKEQEGFRGKELLRPDGDLDEELRADAAEEAVEFGLRVLRVAVGVCF